VGLTAKLDLVEIEGDLATPVETKRGKVPDNAERSWEPERVQVMAQGLLLRADGLRSESGVLYFAASRTRVDIPFTAEIEARTLHLLAAPLRLFTGGGDATANRRVSAIERSGLH